MNNLNTSLDSVRRQTLRNIDKAIRKKHIAKEVYSEIYSRQPSSRQEPFEWQKELCSTY